MPRGVNTQDEGRIQGRNVANANSSNIVAPGIVTDGLVLHLDAGNYESYPIAGTSWYDLSGYGNNGTLTNGPVYTRDGGGAIVFDGTNDYVSVVSDPLLTNKASFEVWVKMDNPAAPNNIGLILGREDSYRILYTSAAVDLVCATVNNSWYSTGTAIQAAVANFTAQTRHVVGTYDGAKLDLYIDGTLSASGSAISGNILTSGTYYLARTKATNVNYGNGSIFVNRIYNRALTPIEVSQNFNATRARFGI